jgi:subtilisin family serine protease
VNLRDLFANILIITTICVLSSCSPQIEKFAYPDNLDSGDTETSDTPDALPDSKSEPRGDYFEEEPAEGPESSEYMGYGFVHAARAVASVLGVPQFPDVDDTDLTSDVFLNMVKAPEVWTQGYTGKGIVVAVIDTGVDHNHPDLVDNMAINTDEILGNGIDDDGNGYIDDALGWDFVNDDNNPMDDNGHGTHLAGIVAAASNGEGITGVAPGAKILPIKAVGADGRSVSWVIAAAVYYAVENGADIINISLGASDVDVLKDATKFAHEAGVVLVYSSGNEGATEPTYPAKYAYSYGIAVGSGTPQSMDVFSNMAGDDQINFVVAPGRSILSTYPGEAYKKLSGTSMATPHVAGLAALLLEANSSLTPDEVIEAITSTARHPSEVTIQNRSVSQGSTSNLVSLPIAYE